MIERKVDTLYVSFRGGKRGSLAADKDETYDVEFDHTDMLNLLMEEDNSVLDVWKHFELLQQRALIAGDFIVLYYYNGKDYVEDTIKNLISDPFGWPNERDLYEDGCRAMPSILNLDAADGMDFVHDCFARL